MKDFKEHFEEKHIFITGGMGSIGSALLKEVLCCSPNRITIADNRETALFYGIWENDDPRVQYLFLDIRDSHRLRDAMAGTDIVFHAAALKHVLVCECNPSEAIATNVVGTQNVIDASKANKVKQMVLISTDKAVNPTNILGKTKLQAEHLVASACNPNERQTTRFGVVRFGNVLYSQGSVLEIWDRRLQRGEKIAITNPSMTRFLMSASQASRLIFTASMYMQKGETFIFKMPSCTIGNLAAAFLELRGYPPDHYERIKPREGDRLNEELLLDGEGALVLENDEFLLHLPPSAQERDKESFELLGFGKSLRTSFASNDAECLLEKDEVKEILAKYLCLCGQESKYLNHCNEVK